LGLARISYIYNIRNSSFFRSPLLYVRVALYCQSSRRCLASFHPFLPKIMINYSLKYKEFKSLFKKKLNIKTLLKY
jgi:hypothetical protein